MRLRDELMLMAGMSDRITATIINRLLPLIAISPDTAREFLENFYRENPGATLDAIVLRRLEELLTRQTLNAMDALEQHSETMLISVGEMTRNHVVRGLESEEFEEPRAEAQRKSGVNKIALAFAGAAGLVALRGIVRTPHESTSGEKLTWPAWVTKASADLSRETRRVLRSARDEGKAVRDIVGELRTLQARGASSAFTTTRSAVTAIANRTLMATYRASGVVTHVRFESVLDDRTSQICMGLSGKVWPVDSGDIQAPPLHPNCRSLLVPVLAGQAEGERPPNYEDWLRGQSTEMQRDILGSSRFAAFRAGLSLSNMATPDQALSVGQLQRLYPDLFKSEAA